MNTFINLLRFLFKAVSYGPVYATALSRIRNPQPLDPDENWEYWTKSRNALLMKALDNYPPAFLRKYLVSRKFKRRHEVGISAHYDVSNDFYQLFLDKKSLVSGYKSNRFNCLESSTSEFCNRHSLSS